MLFEPDAHEALVDEPCISPGTILAGRELGVDVTASVEWLANCVDGGGELPRR